MSDKFVVAFDTSNEVVSIGVGRIVASEASVEFLAEKNISANRQSNCLLLPTIDELLRENSIDKSQIFALGVGVGPGSFTGVRIAIATAKGICEALYCACVPISTLDVIAENARLSGITGEVCVIADAMRGEVYPAKYKVNTDGITRLTDDRVVKAKEFAESEFDGTSLLAGDGLLKYADLFSEKLLLSDDIWQPTGKSMISLLSSGMTAVEGGFCFQGACDAANVLPVYTRLSDAEENEREKLKDNTARNLVSGVQGNATNIEIRPCRASDSSALSVLESKNFGSDCWGESQFASDITRDDRIWYKAVRGDVAVGYIGAMISDKTAEILKVCVDEEFRRQSVAKNLFMQLFDDLRNLSIFNAMLEVRSSNASAIALYESLGFTNIAKRENFYGNESAETFTKNLSSFNAGVSDNIEEVGPECVAKAHHPLIFAIESSCDETAAAIVDGDDYILSSVISSSASFHARFGGVVPEIASRKHIEVISQVASHAMRSAGCTYEDIDAIAVTNRPGLVGSLVVGCAFAKGLAWAADKPLIFVDHLEGHLYANKKASESTEFPAVASLVSGGNTQLVAVRGWGDYEVLGGTIDDAVGEAYDKVARELSLPYPGGPQISKLAEKGDASKVDLPRPLLHSHDLRMSLSGLKTAVILAIGKAKSENGGELSEDSMCNICASFEKSISDVSVAKARSACESIHAKSFCFGGGVAANKNMRSCYQKMCDDLGIKFVVSPLELCGDNAAMIGLVAQDLFKRSEFVDLSGDVSSKSSLSSR